MACGTPVVGSSAGSLPEILGDAAQLPNPSDVSAIGDAILRVIENKERRQRLVQAGIERSQQFTWDQSIHDLEKVCKQAADKA
jgi:glycosyltransferase involved in cell wall biosynthesis